MNFVGYAGYSILIVMAIAWTIGVRFRPGAQIPTITASIFFLVGAIALGVSGANKLHSLWIIPFGFIFSLLIVFFSIYVPILFRLFAMLANFFANIVRFGIHDKKIIEAQEVSSKKMKDNVSFQEDESQFLSGATCNPLLSIEQVFELDDNGVREYVSTLSEKELEIFELKLIKLDDDNFHRYYNLLPECKLEDFERKFPEWDHGPDTELERLEVDWDFQPPHLNQSIASDPEYMREHLSYVMNFVGNVECLQCGHKGPLTIRPPNLMCAECGSTQWRPLVSLNPA